MEKEIVLKMKDIVKTFPGVKALDGAQLNIYKGRAVSYTHLTLPTKLEV